MRIGLIDCDTATLKRGNKAFFPNVSLMKISAWHKQQGDTVEWYRDKMINGHVDKIYVSKVFSFASVPDWDLDADEIEYGGSGFAIEVIDGVEVYDPEKDKKLPYEIEHIYPDYDLYKDFPQTHDTAYGFLQRGCPRACEFCHVAKMQGRKAHRVARLSEFWRGQSKIVLLDPNILACRDWKEMLQELIDSRAEVNFSQGLDVRLLDEEKIRMLMQIKTKSLHFAWDCYEDGPKILPKLRLLKEITGWGRARIMVYVLMGDKERESLLLKIEND